MLDNTFIIVYAVLNLFSYLEDLYRFKMCFILS